RRLRGGSAAAGSRGGAGAAGALADRGGGRPPRGDAPGRARDGAVAARDLPEAPARSGGGGSPQKEKDPAGRGLASDRPAVHNYFIGERHEAGLVLLGTEVKSLREGKATLKDAFARVDGREIYLHNCHISPSSHGGYANHDPLRPRKLLLHRREILKIAQQTRS